MHSCTFMTLRRLPIVVLEETHSFNIQSCKSCMTCLQIFIHMFKYTSKLTKSCRRNLLSNTLMFVCNCISALGQMVDNTIFLQQMKLLQSFLEMVQKQSMSIMKLCSTCKVVVSEELAIFTSHIRLYTMSCCFLKERRDGTSTSLFKIYMSPGRNTSHRLYTMLSDYTLDPQKLIQAISFMVEGFFNNMFAMLGFL